jgi:hypothetical protein
VSSRAEQARERAERIRSMQQASTEETPRKPVPSARTRLVRSTVDLAPVRHTKLALWRTETAAELGVGRITTQDVLRALVARLLTDETLARKIRADLEDDIAQR